MIYNFTARRFCSFNAKTFVLLISFVLSSFFYSYAAPALGNLQKEKASTEAPADSTQKTFTFHKITNGKDNLWKAVFEGGEIVKLYKNGKEIPQENLEDYKDIINEEIAGISPYQFGFHANDFHFHFDRSALDSTLKHLKESLSHKDFCWVDSAFNSEEFKAKMDSMRKDMQGLRHLNLCLPGRFDFKFDTSSFNKRMHELKKNIEHMKFDRRSYESDMGAFKEDMKKFGEQMKHSFNSGEFKSEMRKFEEQMKKFAEEMKHFSSDMKRSNHDLEKYHSFMKGIRHELVKDKLIKSEDEHFSMNFNSKEMIINGKRVPDNLFEKYKKIYKEHFGRDIEDDSNIDNK